MDNDFISLSPIEFIDLEPLDYSPLISKALIKVCYVQDTPNRNKSVLDKETARKMAPSLRGSAIVGKYNEAKEDFEAHNQIIKIDDKGVHFTTDTQPYGFVDLNAKVWFQFFLDKDGVEREYLCTEGYLWTGQFPECQRVIDQGNPQSMEIDEETLVGSWTKSQNSNQKFFIINEAIISKLCILGEDVEPCFEGASITNGANLTFSKQDLYTLINYMKEIIQGGKSQMYTTYAVNIGDTLWDTIWDYKWENYSDYRLEGIYEDNDGSKFIVLTKDNQNFRLNFSIEENGAVKFEGTLAPVVKEFVPREQPLFSLKEYEEYETKFAAQKEEGEKNTEETCPDCGKPLDECTCKKGEEDDEEDKKTSYNLDEIPEYQELLKNYNSLEQKYSKLSEENSKLVEFKASVELKDKEAMIDKFYMLSDEDKADVRANISKYSLDEIEAKLSVICFRNKVSFETEDEEKEEEPKTTFSLEEEVDLTPAWIQAIESTAKNN